MINTLDKDDRYTELGKIFVGGRPYTVIADGSEHDALVPRIQGGAVTVSGLFVLTWIDILDTTQLAIDLDLETHKIALFSNSITPNFSSDTAYAVAPYNANEVTGTNWASGGVALTSTAVSESPTGTLKWAAANVSVASTTLSNARCGLVYADALGGNNAIVLIDFDADYSTSNGTFGITWAAGGIFTIDLTP